MKVQTIYNERTREYYLRKVILGFIPVGYYEINDLADGEDTTLHHRRDYVERYCGTNNQGRVFDAINVLKRIKQRKKLPRHKVVASEKV